ncbi:DNA helicase UvrD [Candidatus Woesearchaeota archaeon]|nr:DNA helicase UvrD [Candidatus Woesearchaeota archaeon]
MKFIADLHLHSKYSRATSKDLDLSNLEKYARIKGINLLGTGDFTHPVWLKELKNSLSEDGSGILKTKNGFNFLLSVEISNIYSQDGKGRRIHNIILAPSFEIVEQINAALGKKGRLDYDGRPIFGFNCIELVEMLKGISDEIEIIPAHAWTPWFSIFGSMSGFDSIKECFGEKEKEIHAIETGLSSDPEMNWRLSQLDDISLVSFSDAHSFWPWRIGREATVFDIKPSYKELINAIRTRHGLTETIEVNPNYGKYHLDGHRACNICLEPKDSLKRKNICPKCSRKLTIGVLHRVEDLADRKESFRPKNARPFVSLIPLAEILSKILGSGIASQKTWKEYYNLIGNFGSEFNILLDAAPEELKKITSVEIADVIIKNRSNEIRVKPGYDGVYGEPILSGGKDEKIIRKQKNLLDFS